MIRWLDHTADVQMEITCGTYEAVFVELVKGLRELLVQGDIRELGRREVHVEEPAPEDLIVSLGRTTLRYFYGEEWVPARLEVQEASQTRLKGALWGEPFNPARHTCQLEVKGVTYHALLVEQKGKDWRAVVTFDV